MNKRNLLNLGLLAFIGLLALLAVYEPGIEQPAEAPTLLQLEKTALRQITITRDGQQEVVLAADDKGKWWMEKPIHHAADPFRIDSLLRITTLKSLTSFAAEPDKLSAYQLDKPRVTLTLNGDTTIAFGTSTPLDQRRYVMVNGKVHLISDTLYYHLIGSYQTFLRKQLLDEGSGIEALTLPGLSVTWQQERWQLSPEPTKFSADQVTQLLDSWRLASALEIKPYDGKGGEAITLKLRESAQPLELLLTAREPDLILARPALGIQYHFDATSAAKLLQLPSSQEKGEATVDEAPAGEDDHR